LNVLLDEVSVDGDGGGRAFACRCDDLRARIRDVPRSPDAGDTRSADAVDEDEAKVVDRTAEALQKTGSARPDVRADEESCSLDHSTVAERHTAQAICFDDEPPNLAVDNADPARFEQRSLGLGEGIGVREEDEVV
jgi:hypothetical protein